MLEIGFKILKTKVLLLQAVVAIKKQRPVIKRLFVCVKRHHHHDFFLQLMTF